MGWFNWLSSSSSDSPDPARRQDRQRCWDSRDAYFICLDSKGVVKPGDEGDACADVKQPYEKNCAKSWIEYFNKRRVLADQQQDVLAQARNQAADAKRK